MNPLTRTEATTLASTPTAPPRLEVRGVTVRYGALTAVDSASLSVPVGTRHALIGPNGAGKSSLFAALAGAQPMVGGSVFLDGEEITDHGEVRRVRKGLVRTYQHSNLFPQLTVLDNVRVAVERTAGRPLRPWSRSGADRRITESAVEAIEGVGLADRLHATVAALSHGERRQVEVALVMACRPKVVLFDEPTAGMSAAETHRFAALVESLPNTMATVIIEHDLDVVFRLAHRITVLSTGKVIASGTPDAVRDDPAVQEAYLGSGHDDDPLFGAVAR